MKVMAKDMSVRNTKPPTATPMIAPVLNFNSVADLTAKLGTVEGATVGAPVGEEFTTDGAASADMPEREGFFDI